MNAQMKKRMAIVGGIIVIVVILLLAFLGGGNAAKVTSVADAAAGSADGSKIQVTGKVVDNSYSVDGTGTLNFDIADENDAAQATTVHVSYDKGVSSTFGNGVTAICTGRMENGTLTCSELVTKCPSKYENASEALTVSQLLGYETSKMQGKTVKVTGYVGKLADATSKVRFVLSDEAGGDSKQSTLSIAFSGALSDEVVDGTQVVVTGSLTDGKGNFLATEVSVSK